MIFIHGISLLSPRLREAVVTKFGIKGFHWSIPTCRTIRFPVIRTSSTPLCLEGHLLVIPPPQSVLTRSALHDRGGTDTTDRHFLCLVELQGLPPPPRSLVSCLFLFLLGFQSSDLLPTD